MQRATGVFEVLFLSMCACGPKADPAPSPPAPEPAAPEPAAPEPNVEGDQALDLVGRAFELVHEACKNPSADLEEKFAALLDPEFQAFLDARWVVLSTADKTSKVFQEPVFEKALAGSGRKIPEIHCPAGGPPPTTWPCLENASDTDYKILGTFVEAEPLDLMKKKPPQRAYDLENRLSGVKWIDRVLGCSDDASRFHLGMTEGEAGPKLVLYPIHKWGEQKQQ